MNRIGLSQRGLVAAVVFALLSLVAFDSRANPPCDPSGSQTAARDDCTLDALTSCGVTWDPFTGYSCDRAIAILAVGRDSFFCEPSPPNPIAPPGIGTLCENYTVMVNGQAQLAEALCLTYTDCLLSYETDDRTGEKTPTCTTSSRHDAKSPLKRSVRPCVIQPRPGGGG